MFCSALTAPDTFRLERTHYKFSATLGAPHPPAVYLDIEGLTFNTFFSQRTVKNRAKTSSNHTGKLFVRHYTEGNTYGMAKSMPHRRRTSPDAPIPPVEECTETFASPELEADTDCRNNQARTQRTLEHLFKTFDWVKLGQRVTASGRSRCHKRLSRDENSTLCRTCPFLDPIRCSGAACSCLQCPPACSAGPESFAQNGTRIVFSTSVPNL